MSSLESVSFSICNLSELVRTLLTHSSIKYLNISNLQIVRIPSLNEMVNLNVFSLHWVTPVTRLIKIEGEIKYSNHIEYEYLKIPLENIPL